MDVAIAETLMEVNTSIDDANVYTSEHSAAGKVKVGMTDRLH